MVHLLMCLLLSQPKPLEPAPADLKPAAKAVPVAMPADVKALVDRMQSFYEKTTDFSADFKQDYTYKSFKRTVSSSGKVVYRRPGLMRWDYLKPSAKVFVLAGDKVYAYDSEAMTLTKMTVATSQLSASVTFLFGQGKLADEFSIAKKACPTCTGTLLELTPLRPDARFQKVLFEIDPKTAQVIKSTVIDPDGSENAISFGTLTLNSGVDEKNFKLTPPEGTQVIDYTKLSPAAPKP